MTDSGSKAVFSTAEVAHLFDVTETTIKRWVASGILHCRTTPGGHRKYDAADVMEFARQHDLLPAGFSSAGSGVAASIAVQRAVRDRDLAALRIQFTDAALRADRGQLRVMLDSMYDLGMSTVQIADDIITPSFVSIGERWERGEIDVADEHAATNSVTDALIALQARIPRDPANGLVAICAAAPEDQHDLGLRCAAHVLEERGWSIRFLGARTPLEALLSAVRSTRPDIVCLSFSNLVTRTEGEAILRALRGAVRTPRPTIVLGGAGALDRYAAAGRCDALCHSTADLNGYLLRRSSAIPVQSFTTRMP